MFLGIVKKIYTPTKLLTDFTRYLLTLNYIRDHIFRSYFSLGNIYSLEIFGKTRVENLTVFIIDVIANRFVEIYKPYFSFSFANQSMKFAITALFGKIL